MSEEIERIIRWSVVFVVCILMGTAVYYAHEYSDKRILENHKHNYLHEENLPHEHHLQDTKWKK